MLIWLVLVEGPIWLKPGSVISGVCASGSLVEREGLCDYIQINLEHLKVSDDLLEDFWKGMFRDCDQRFAIEILRGDGVRTKEPVVCWDAEHQIFIEQFSRLQFGVVVRQVPDANLI
jgi:hypothetical protein